MLLSVQQELLLAAILGLLATTDLKAQVSTTMYGTDASPHRAGISQRLLSSVGATLHERGLPVEEPEFLLEQEGGSSSQTEEDPQAVEPFARPSEQSCHLPQHLHALHLKFAAAVLSESARLQSLSEFDFLEIYAGTVGVSKAMLQAGFTVGPPIELKQGWDLSDSSLFELIFRLAWAGRIGFIWLGPPCTTYLLARAPRLRSSSAEWGFEILNIDTARGNLHLHQALALFVAKSCAGNEAVVETPWGAYSRKLPWWRLLESCSLEVRVDQCVGMVLLTRRLRHCFVPQKALVPWRICVRRWLELQGWWQKAAFKPLVRHDLS